MITRTSSAIRASVHQPERISAGARLFARGGIVCVPYGAYVSQLQAKFAAKNYRAHSNLLYPGLAHICAADDSRLASLFASILAVSRLGKNLAGLESLFLSCLQGLQFVGNVPLCLVGIGAWTKAHHSTNQPVIFVDRQRNELKYIPARQVEGVYRQLTPRKLLQNNVADLVRRAEVAIENSPSSYLTKAEQVDASDCKDKWSVWTAFGAASAGATTAVAAAVATASGDNGKGAAISAGAGALFALGAATANMFGLYGCRAADAADKADDDVANKKASDALQQLQQQIQQQTAQLSQQIQNASQDIQEQLLENAVRNAAGSLSPPSSAGDYNVPGDPHDAMNDYLNGTDPGQQPPTQETTDAPTTEDSLPPDEPTEGPTAYAMPNPEDSGEQHAWPPGFHWPQPPSDMPNPDDVGPGGPVSLPNGAVFLPSSLLTTIARTARITLAVNARANLESSAVGTFQAVVTQALGTSAVRG
jgi:hypothetical protein